MSSNAWMFIALIALMALCCGPMLFMGRHRSKGCCGKKTSDGTQGDPSCEKQPEHNPQDKRDDSTPPMRG